MQTARFGVSWVDDIAILVIEGEIDVSNAIEFRERYTALAKHASSVVVDLTRCRYMDSEGIKVLAKCATDFGAPRALVVPSGSPVRRLFDILDLAELLRVVGTVEEATRPTPWPPA